MISMLKAFYRIKNIKNRFNLQLSLQLKILFKNSSWLFIGKLFSLITDLGKSVILGRILGPQLFGTYVIIIAFITSRISGKQKLGDYLIQNWQKANLPKPSIIRMKFATIDKGIIIKSQVY